MLHAGGRFHGLEIELRRFGGAKASRVVHPGGQRIAAHRHDWACLTLPVLGGCMETHEAGDASIAGPFAILHPPGAWHANVINDQGMETVSIQFDPLWTRRRAGTFPRIERTRYFGGGAIGGRARMLARAWAKRELPEPALADATAAFLDLLSVATIPSPPRWFDEVKATLDRDPACVLRLARTLAIQPAWLARAYRRAAGEGLRDTIRRKCIEHAVGLLRKTEHPLAEIALAAGFCDQSHMNRVFAATIGRTPARVRAEGRALDQVHACA